MPPLTASQELRALGKAARTASAKEPGLSRDSSPGRASSSPGQAASSASRDPGPAKDSGSSAGSAPQPPSADSAYGPDDPGYGPPDHDWYERRRRERELEMEREEEEFLAEAAEETPKPKAPSSASSVFEPRSSRPSSGTGAPEETSLDQFLKSDDGSDLERDPLDRVKDMYLAAEAVSDSDLDRRLEELLERQRGLIGAYLGQSRPSIP